MELKRTINATPVTSSLALEGPARESYEEIANSCDGDLENLFDPWEQDTRTAEEWEHYAKKVRKAAQYLNHLAVAVEKESERLKDTPPPSGIMTLRDGFVRTFKDKIIVVGTYDDKRVEIELLGTTKIEAW